jgi:hypothetical protein
MQAVHPGGMASQVLGLEPETWDVIGTLVTVGTLPLAATAALIAALQYRHNRKIRADQTRPYIVIFAEPSPVSRKFIDIVIRNLGSTAARDLSITIDPPLVRAQDEDAYPAMAARVFREPIPMWPPGYHLRMFFDSHIDRHGKDLPSRHVATLSYSDGRGGQWREEMIVDLDLGKGMLYTDVFGEHHTAKALRGIEKTLARAPLLHGEVKATIASRDEREERETAGRALDPRPSRPSQNPQAQP